MAKWASVNILRDEVIEPEASNCFSIIFRGEYQLLVLVTYAVVVLIISLHLHRLSISLLVEFDNKTNERNTAKDKFILCFIVVDFIHSCHHRLKVSSFSLKK